MAIAAAPSLSFAAGGYHSRSTNLPASKLKQSGSCNPKLAIHQKPNRANGRRNLSVCAEYSNRSRSDGGEFLAGFLLGGALFGSLLYIYGPQIRKAILNENEHGFRRPRKLVYYQDDSGLEKTRRMLNDKIHQLNEAIDNVYFRLRYGNSGSSEPPEVDSEVEAST